MAPSSTLISYYTIAKLFEDDIKLLKRGENALRSGHLESCSYDSTSGVINGKRKNLQRSRKHRWLQSAEKHILIFFFLSLLKYKRNCLSPFGTSCMAVCFVCSQPV